MDPTDIGLFRVAEQRLAWVDQRQKVLAQNVANAYTPGFQASDVAPFSAAMNQADGSLSRTSPLHLEGKTSGLNTHKEPGTKSPDGNNVALEDQLVKVADTSSTQELVTNLYHKYQGLFRTALGRTG